MTATKDEFFNSAKLSAREKAAVTDNTARSIIAAEASERDKKTERLKLMRLEREAAEPPRVETPRKGRKVSNH